MTDRPIIPQSVYERHFERDPFGNIVSLRFGDRVYKAAGAPEPVKNKYAPPPGQAKLNPSTSPLENGINDEDSLRLIKNVFLNGHLDEDVKLVKISGIDFYQIKVRRDKLNPGENAYLRVDARYGKPNEVIFYGSASAKSNLMPRKNTTDSPLLKPGTPYMIPSNSNYVYFKK